MTGLFLLFFLLFISLTEKSLDILGYCYPTRSAPEIIPLDIATQGIIPTKKVYVNLLRMFPHIVRLRIPSHLGSKAAFHLRTVIVTAAVHRGFGRQLLPEE